MAKARIPSRRKEKVTEKSVARRTRVSRRALGETRRKVIAAVESGLSPETVAQAFGCGRSTVYGWIAEHRLSGEESFQVKEASGRPPLLNKRQRDQLYRWIVGKDPRQLQFEFALWTREMVRELIGKKFGIEMSVRGVGALLHRMGLSPQRPLVRACQQDPERVRRWKEEEYPALVRRAEETSAKIFFSDEAGMRTDYHSGTTWGALGQTPIVRGSGQRKSLNMISAVSTRGKLHFTFVEGRVNADAFIDYLRKLLHDVKGKIILVVDGHPSHKAKKVREFVASTKGRLELHFLPPYSPELNPDEWVWNNLKSGHVGKMAVQTVEEMRAGIEKAVARLQSTKELVLGFFRSPDLSYIAITERAATDLSPVS